MTERQVTRSDAEYPHRLDGIDGVPDTIWVHGGVSLDPDRTVAIVGTRSPFHLSAEVAQAIGRVAAKLGCTIVSGYATGIDTAGHWGAADEDAPTIAVLGSGIRQKEPLKPALERYILSKGVFVSEVPDPNARRATKYLLDLPNYGSARGRRSHQGTLDGRSQADHALDHCERQAGR